MFRSTRGAALAALMLTSTLATSVAEAAPGVVVGTVGDAFMHPMPGAKVVVHDAGGKTIAETVTGADGKFAFPAVPPGDYTVEATAPGLEPDHQHVQVGDADLPSVDLTLVAESEVIEIHEDWSVPEPTKATGSVTTVDRQKLADLPGSDDRPVTQVIATQPGFVADSLGNVYARGNHAGIQYRVDGVPVPDSVGSLFAASIPVRLIDSLQTITGGMPAEYGRRLGAVVELTTRSAAAAPDGAATVRYGSFQTFEPGVSYATKTGPIGVMVGGSYLYSQRMLEPPSRDVAFHDTGSSGRVFTRLDYQPCDVNRYELFATYAHNRFQVPIDPTVPVFDPGIPRPTDRFGNESPAHVPLDTNATETEDELFVAYAFSHQFEDRSTVMLAPLYKLSRGHLYADAPHALGDDADPGAVASNVNRTAQHAGGVASVTVPRGHHVMKFGAELDGLYGVTSFRSFVRDDEQGGIDQAMTADGTDRTKAVTSSLYAQDRWTHGSLVLDLGLRADQMHVILDGGGTDDSFGVSPRLGASYAFTKDTIGHAFTGVLWQPPAPLDAANAARALGVVPAGTPVAYDLKPETDIFSELGVTSKLSKYLNGGLTAWGRYAWNQLDDTSIGSTSLDSNYNFRRGRAAGLEGSSEIRVGPWLSLFGNAALGVAQGQGIASARYLFSAEDLANTSWQSLDHAQTLTANGGGTVRDGRYQLTALGSYGSGLRTGPGNTAHVPGHFTLDLTSSYAFAPKGYPVKVTLDVENLFDRRYAFRIANGFVGSSYAAGRAVYVSLSVPLAREPHHKGE